MTSDRHDLAERRRRLLARSAYLRSQITDDAANMADHLRLVDRVTRIFGSRGARVALVAGMVLIMATRPTQAFKLASRVAIGWSLVRRVLPHLETFRQRRHRA